MKFELFSICVCRLATLTDEESGEIKRRKKERKKELGRSTNK
jgi:hypothetical protein